MEPKRSTSVQRSRFSRHALAGSLILLMIVATLANGMLGSILLQRFIWFAGLAGWMAALLLLNKVSKALKIQVSILIGIGVLLMLYAKSKGGDIDIVKAVNGNTELLTMVTAVGFLKLVAIPPRNSTMPLPIGHKAYRETILGTLVFGSFINISAPILIADRIDMQQPLTRLAAQSIIRVFCGCASWSPFFAAMAIVLTYVPDVRLPWIMLLGFPFALTGLLLVYTEALLRFKPEVQAFVGYPMQASNLKIPGLLALAVLLCGWSYPKLSIFVIIATSALIITIATLYSRRGLSGALTDLYDHIRNGLPRTINELILFLAAGVLATGIAAGVQAGNFALPDIQFSALTAMQVLGVIVLIAAIGVHPIILISSFTPLLLVLHPDPNLLALVYLFGWSLGTAASPLSGTNLVFQGRYGIPSWKTAIWNWPYVLFMYALGCVWLWAIATHL